MGSTHFPRANFTNTASHEDAEAHRPDERMGHGTQDAPQPHAGQVVRLHGGESPYTKPKGSASAGDAFPKFSGIESPGWQDYFFLGPNVRFTRTPDVEVKKPGASSEGPAEAKAPAPVQAAPDLPTPAQPTKPAVAATAPAIPSVPMTSSRPAAQPSNTPARPASPSLERVVEKAQVLNSAAPAMAAAARIAARPSTVSPSIASPKTPVPAAHVAPRWSYLSDHAFFELGTLETFGMVTAPAPSVAAPTAPAPIARPITRAIPPAVAVPAAAKREQVRQADPVDVTAMFRVIECLHGMADSFPSPDISPANSNEAVPEAKAEADALHPAVSEEPAPAMIEEPSVSAPVASRVETTTPAFTPRPAPALPMAGKVERVEFGEGYELPSEELLQLPPEGQGFYMSQERLEQNADLLESVLEDFGVRGEIIHVRPGPVVTLYEFEPAPGVKSSRVIGLADDIARSMSAISARVAVIPGRNVIGIELPNETRETVYFRELIESDGFRNTSCKLALGLGKTIGGEPVIAELAKMPHLLVAGTTGSGKSVAINTMILSLLYRLKPEECRLIMVDPKMLELSIYDGIPHLLTPVVTDPKKAVTALKWAVREMEDRYRKMARLGVRNIDGYNQRAAVARDKGETVVMQVQTGFEKGTGAPLFEEQEIDLAPMPYIVVIVDEMADLMMVAGKEIEGAIQRLAQMARAAGIHLIMATQRPSVDVITGTIKANFPTRISFQVTSKIDSRTILGEQGAEQLLGQGDMLHMAGGGRIARVHGPFVSDAEVEQVVAHLKAQGRPEYLETVTADEEDEAPEADDSPVFDKGSVAAEDGDSIFDEAVKVVLRDKKCSTSYIQRRLGIGYNRAASLVEKMEKEGIVGAPNHVGKREILFGKRDHAAEPEDLD